MKIDSMAAATGLDIYYDDSFRVVLEDHMSYLRNDSQTSYINIEPMDAYKYRGDLFGLLAKLNISPNLHWIIMRLNNFYSPTKAPDNISSLAVPNASVIERIKAVYQTQNKIKN